MAKVKAAEKLRSRPAPSAGVKAIKVPSRFYSMVKEGAEKHRRSVPMQVQYLAEMGHVIEEIGVTKEQLVQAAKAIQESRQVAATPAQELLASLVRTFDSPRADIEAAFRALIEPKKGPVYGTAAEHPGKIIELRPDGSRVVGTLKDREFVPDESADQA